jgi:hypothetical protein
MQINSYPSQFDEIQNQIIECHRQGLPPPEDLEILQEWLMSDGWDHALAAWDDEAVVLKTEPNALNIADKGSV